MILIVKLNKIFIFVFEHGFKLMGNFINQSFLLSNKSSKDFFDLYSKKLPIIDFHNHLSPKLIAEDHQYNNLGQLWLDDDHYKWRAMRANGVYDQNNNSETDKQRFIKWADTVPKTVGNPLYHWTHLELARYFDIHQLLSAQTADKIYEETKEKLRSTSFSVRNLLRMQNVELLCTTDDIVDDLRFHKQLKMEEFEISVLPTFRADNILKTEDPQQFISYVEKLQAVTSIDISNLQTLLEAVEKRHAYFHDHGCRLSDTGISRFYFMSYTESEINSIIKKLFNRQVISEEEDEKYKACIMSELARMNHTRGWVQQYHLGPIRNNNRRKFNEIGADTGFDSIGGTQDPQKIADFFNHLDQDDQLSKTILYNINPADNEMIITMCGNFNDGKIVGKMQHGAAWWFLDQKAGIEKQLMDLSVLGLLRHFVGMVTDSRSFLSFTRHEYYRRIACDFIGKQVEMGLIPNEKQIIKPLIEGISYNNAKNYLNF